MDNQFHGPHRVNDFETGPKSNTVSVVLRALLLELEAVFNISKNKYLYIIKPK